MPIAYKIRNLTDQLDAHAAAKILDADMFRLALDTLRLIADEVEALENVAVPGRVVAAGNLTTALERLRAAFAPHAGGGVMMDETSIAQVLAVLDAAVAEARQLEGGEPLARLHAGDPGVVDFVARRTQRELCAFFRENGYAVSARPCDVEPPTDGGAA